jgi:hypothetical protein
MPPGSFPKIVEGKNSSFKKAKETTRSKAAVRERVCECANVWIVCGLCVCACVCVCDEQTGGRTGGPEVPCGWEDRETPR